MPPVSAVLSRLYASGHCRTERYKLTVSQNETHNTSLEQVFLLCVWMHLKSSLCVPPLIFGWRNSARKSSHGSKLLLFDNYWDQCASGIVLSFRYYFSPYPWSMPHHNLITEVNRELLEGPYIHWCATFWYNTQSLHFPLNGLKSSSGWDPKIIQVKLIHLTSLELQQIVWMLHEIKEFNLLINFEM